MEITLDLVYVCAITILSIGLLLWFILGFVPSVLDLKGRDQEKP
jgi:hypothetical protein